MTATCRVLPDAAGACRAMAVFSFIERSRSAANEIASNSPTFS